MSSAAAVHARARQPGLRSCGARTNATAANTQRGEPEHAKARRGVGQDMNGERRSKEGTHQQSRTQFSGEPESDDGRHQQEDDEGRGDPVQKPGG